VTSVYASTSGSWFEHLKNLYTTPDQVAFWRPSNVQARRIQQGELWFFKEWGKPQILGFGRFVRYEETTPQQLWKYFEEAAGAGSENDLLEKIISARRKATDKDAIIGNVVLTNFTPFHEPISLTSIGLADLSVPFRYVPANSAALTLALEFETADRLNELKEPPKEEFGVFNPDQEWREGGKKLRMHLTVERNSSVGSAKRAHFLKRYGYLFCEKCGFKPHEIYPALVAEACIEVHHRRMQMDEMPKDHVTKLEDLQCLCANCHRVVHRELNAVHSDRGSSR
jgi:hypothetical protein